jgi:hypothetical protein
MSIMCPHRLFTSQSPYKCAGIILALVFSIMEDFRPVARNYQDLQITSCFELLVSTLIVNTNYLGSEQEPGHHRGVILS